MLAMEQRLRWCGIDLRARWKRRVAVLLTCGVFFVFAAWVASDDHLHRWAFWLLLLAYIAFSSLTVFRDNSFAKPRGGLVALNGLDDWAMYRFGSRFDALPEDKQQMLLMRYRVGRYMVPAKLSRDPNLADEREIKLNDKAFVRTLNGLPSYICGLAGTYAFAKKPVSGLEVATWLIVVAAAMRVGPRAVLLWNEPDPRDMAAEIHLIDDSTAA